jgi:predicted dehydrogenase
VSAPVRAAVIGAGLMGLWHARALTRAGGRLQLVIDRDAARAGRLASTHRGCATAASTDALAAQQISVVHICTPTASHAGLVRAALEAGCHVLVEKPLAEDEATTKGLIALAAARGRLLCPVHQVLFQRGVVETFAALDRVAPRHVDLVMCSAGAEATGAADDLVAEILPHPLSFIAALMPELSAQSAWTLERVAPGEMRAFVVSGGKSASILISAHGRPTVNGARLIGERATVHFDFFHGFAVTQDGAVSRARKIAQPFLLSGTWGMAATGNLMRRVLAGQAAYPGLWELVAAFYARIGSTADPPIPARDTVRVAAIRDRLLAGKGVGSI